MIEEFRFNDLILQSLGDFYALNLCCDIDEVDSQLLVEGLPWVPYNTDKKGYNRQGMSLTSLKGETSGEIDLNSLHEYNKRMGTSYDEMDFRTKTAHWDQFDSITKKLGDFESFLGRSHILKMDEGGFFPPHRDLGNTFRLIAFFNCNADELYFVMDGKKIEFETGRFYYANTRLRHTLMSFGESCYVVVLNVELCSEAVATVQERLLIT